MRTLVDRTDNTAPAAVRLGAARAIIDLGVRLGESNELEDRIDALGRCSRGETLDIGVLDQLRIRRTN